MYDCKVSNSGKFNYIICGAGFSGLMVLYELLQKGVKIKDILMIDLVSPESNVVSRKIEYSVLEVAKKERKTKGISKSTLNLAEVDSFDRPGFYWGLSCFELDQQSIRDLGFDLIRWNELFEDTFDFFEVQSPSIENRHRPFTQRKQEAIKLASLNSKLHHSWLALSSEGNSACNLNGGCFQYCSRQAPMTPGKLFNKITELYGQINLIEAKANKCHFLSKTIETSAGNYKYDKLILTVGSEGTRKFLNESSNIQLELFHTPVVLMPFIKVKKTSEKDFQKHFSYSDLIFHVNLQRDGGFFGQIYLPSIEITGRILASLPRFVTSLYRVLPQTILDNVSRRIGIVMIFLSQSELSDGNAEVKHEMKKCFSMIAQIMNSSGLFALKTFSRYLLNGASRHSGALHQSHSDVAGFKGSWWKELADLNVYVLDTSALPRIQPGPHTLIGVTLARYLVVKFEI